MQNDAKTHYSVVGRKMDKGQMDVVVMTKDLVFLLVEFEMGSVDVDCNIEELFHVVWTMHQGFESKRW